MLKTRSDTGAHSQAPAPDFPKPRDVHDALLGAPSEALRTCGQCGTSLFAAILKAPPFGPDCTPENARRGLPWFDGAHLRDPKVQTKGGRCMPASPLVASVAGAQEVGTFCV